MAKTASQVLAETGNFVFDESAPVSETGTPVDGVSVLLRLFIRQEATIVPPYAVSIVGADPEIPGT